MPNGRHTALAAVFGCLTACSVQQTVTFRPVTQGDRVARAWYLGDDATAIAELATNSGTLVIVRRQCSQRYGSCVYSPELVSGDRGRDLGTFIGKTVAADGSDESGFPKFRVDGEPCVYLPDEREPDGSYRNAALNDRPPPGRPFVAVPLPSGAAERAGLRNRGAIRPYRAFADTILPNDATATLIRGASGDQSFSLFAGRGGPSDREVLRQQGKIDVAAMKTNGANDLIVERFPDDRFVFRYDGTRYVPAPCQGAAALRPYLTIE